VHYFRLMNEFVAAKKTDLAQIYECVLKLHIEIISWQTTPPQITTTECTQFHFHPTALATLSFLHCITTAPHSEVFCLCFKHKMIYPSGVWAQPNCVAARNLLHRIHYCV
jgi:hypothetical protein